MATNELKQFIKMIAKQRKFLEDKEVVDFYYRYLKEICNRWLEVGFKIGKGEL